MEDINRVIDRVTIHGRTDQIKEKLVDLAAEALDSNCPLAFVDRITQTVEVLDVIGDFIAAGPRRAVA